MLVYIEDSLLGASDCVSSTRCSDRDWGSFVSFESALAISKSSVIDPIFASRKENSIFLSIMKNRLISNKSRFLIGSTGDLGW